MHYRKLGRTGWQVSAVGLGCEHLQGMDYEGVERTVHRALDLGINIFDVFMSEPQVRTDIGRALKHRSEKVYLQGHIGAIWQDGQYARNRDVALNRMFFDDFMDRLSIDHLDIGMIHFVDTEADYSAVFDTPLLDFVLQLKKEGRIGSIGLSSHNPGIAQRAVETGLVDVLMFSLNPAFDLLPADVHIDDLFVRDTFQKETLLGLSPEREDLYRVCETQGTAITVMKALGAGTLLNAELSPFGRALTPYQCIRYALDRPAVASVLVGCRTPEEVEHAAAFPAASEHEKDYSELLSQTSAYGASGRCMYCNHCLPCPSHIDIASVLKYLDLAEASIADNGSIEGIPATLRAHYEALEATAQDCIACGQCEPRCPFHVAVIDKMERAAALFGR